jgi:membrane fusion protein (multidrug efflux system)
MSVARASTASPGARSRRVAREAALVTTHDEAAPRPQRHKSATLVVMMLSAALAGACGAGHSDAGDAHSTASASAAPVEVAVAPVIASAEPVTIRATGSLVAVERADVSPQFAGRVVATPVDVGQLVSVGEVIARLDDRNARARVAGATAVLRQAEAAATLAQVQADRSARLLETGDVSRSDFQALETQSATTRAQVDQAKAQLAVADQDLAETIIRAPFRGLISARPVSVGTYVTTGSPVATIVRTQPIRLELQVAEADAARINVGMPVTANVVSHGDRAFTGRVLATNPALNVASRALSVIAEFENRDLALSPGMFATATLALPETTEVLSIPKDALFTPAGSPSPQVYVALNGKARLRVLQVGAATGDVVRVLSGLNRGDVVVTSTPDALIDGQAIAIRQAASRPDRRR